MDQPEPPKLPKLKLGAMIASKKEKKRRESNDSEPTATKVPKLKIKLGPKPEKPLDEVKDEKELAEKPVENDQNVKPSPMSSPTKRGSKIDSLAAGLLNKIGGGTPSDLESIFGPSGVPLDMSGSHDLAKKSAEVTEKQATEKSELEMIQEELANNTGSSVNTGGKCGTTPNFIQSSPAAGASPHACTVDGPLKKAINAGKASALEKEKEKTTSFSADIPENYEYPKKHLKL